VQAGLHACSRDGHGNQTFRPVPAQAKPVRSKANRLSGFLFRIHGKRGSPGGQTKFDPFDLDALGLVIEVPGSRHPR
jgi:hypothetical protein